MIHVIFVNTNQYVYSVHTLINLLILTNMHNININTTPNDGSSAISIVIFWLFCNTSIFIGTDFFFYHLETFTSFEVLAVTHAVVYLLYPLLGWLSDVYFTRYKVIRFAFIIMILVAFGSSLVALSVVLDINIVHHEIGKIMVMLLIIPAFLSVLLSLGLFEANAIQFGMDQLLESSSDQLSSFIHWYYWSSYVDTLFCSYSHGNNCINSSYTKGSTRNYPIGDNV